LTKETKKTKDDNETEKQLKDNTNDAMDWHFHLCIKSKPNKTFIF
jgi:hypothetical protein